MKPPPGHPEEKSGKVCRLKRSLYGLKQASRQWNLELTKFLLNENFEQSKRDYSLFFRKQDGKHVIILIYVDDLLITGDDQAAINILKQKLDNAFTCKDLGEIRFFLGIEVSRNEKGTMLNQRKFVLDIIQQAGMTDCKPCKFPFPKGIKLHCS